MIINGGQLVGGTYQDQAQIVTTNLIEYLDAADYVGSGSTWPARLGAAATLYNSPNWNSTGGTYFTFDPGSLQFADTPWLGDLSNWTVECWYNLTASLTTTQATSVVTTVYDDGAGTNYGQINYCLGNNGLSSGTPNIKAGYFTGSAWVETTGFAPTVGQWYQIVGTYDGATLSTYVNGALDSATSSIDSTTANGAPTRIARRWDGPPGDPSNYFPGSVSIVRIYNAALNSTQVQQNYNASKGRFGL